MIVAQGAFWSKSSAFPSIVFLASHSHSYQTEVIVYKKESTFTYSVASLALGAVGRYMRQEGMSGLIWGLCLVQGNTMIGAGWIREDLGRSNSTRIS